MGRTVPRMNVAAIDPGPETHGLCLAQFDEFDLPRSVPAFTFFSDIETNTVKSEIAEFCSEVGSDIVIACEYIACFGMAVGASVFETAYNVGGFREWVSREIGAPADFDRIWFPVYRLKVKIALCGQARAKDANISQALRDQYGQTGTKKNPGPLYGCHGHAWSALAIAEYTRRTYGTKTPKTA
jgi:hypothetical protein